MTFNRITFTAVALATMTFASASMAQGLSREQVRAEYAQAVANGTLIADGQTGATYRDLNPTRYPAMPMAMKSRAEVLAELAHARAEGTLIANGELGTTFRQQSPGLYPQMQATLPRGTDAQTSQARQAPGAM